MAFHVSSGHFPLNRVRGSSSSFARTSILGSISGLAVVGKFRSRIRLLQFSTRKITPHGNVYISSAIRPIEVYLFLCSEFSCGTNLGIEPFVAPQGVSALSNPLRRGRGIRVHYLPLL